MHSFVIIMSMLLGKKTRQSQAFVWYLTKMHKCIFIKWFLIQGKTWEIKYLFFVICKKSIPSGISRQRKEDSPSNEKVCPWSDKSDSCKPYLIINEFYMCSRGKKSLYSTGNSILTDHLMVLTHSYALLILAVAHYPQDFIHIAEFHHHIQ